MKLCKRVRNGIDRLDELMVSDRTGLCIRSPNLTCASDSVAAPLVVPQLPLHRMATVFLPVFPHCGLTLQSCHHCCHGACSYITLPHRKTVTGSVIRIALKEIQKEGIELMKVGSMLAKELKSKDPPKKRQRGPKAIEDKP